MASQRDDLQARVDVVDLHDIGPAGRDPRTVESHVDRIDRLHARRRIAEHDRSRDIVLGFAGFVRVVLGPRVDPHLEQPELERAHRLVGRLILGRHHRHNAVRRHLEHQALVRLAAHDRRPALAPLEHPRNRFQTQSLLRQNRPMTPGALVLQQLGNLA